MSNQIKVLFVCMGNICRSPSAEGVFRHMAKKAGMARRIIIDSAGTHGYHVGDCPDPRARAAAERRGYDLSELRGRQVQATDFEEFDYILAMDLDNLLSLQKICPPMYKYKLSLFMEHSQMLEREVPDPYYGGTDGFERVLDMLEDASKGLLKKIKIDLNRPQLA